MEHVYLSTELQNIWYLLNYVVGVPIYRTTEHLVSAQLLYVVGVPEVGPQPGGETTKSIRDMWWRWHKTKTSVIISNPDLIKFRDDPNKILQHIQE
jgi:hypothetical protein